MQRFLLLALHARLGAPRPESQSPRRLHLSAGAAALLPSRRAACEVSPQLTARWPPSASSWNAVPVPVRVATPTCSACPQGIAEGLAVAQMLRVRAGRATT